YIYAVDDESKLIGWIDVRSLLVAPREKELRSIVTKPPVVVNANTDREEAARLVVKYDLLEIPVVDDEERLLGAITIDDLLDVMVAELTEDLLKFGGYAETIKSRYLGAKIIELVRKRAPWLIVLYILETATVTVVNSFSNVIAQAAILAAFLPLLIATGGNVGAQAATLVIRSLAIGETRIRDIGKVLLKELRTSLLLSSILAPLGFTIAFTISHSISIAFAVSIALVLIITIASLIGSLLPFIALSMKIDPAVVSSPFLSTLCDVTGALVYFTIANYIVQVMNYS
ncbi:MAG TPA: magnesium transporter, partial [Ignisphaera sp.]|nr:magnesium transporter [Ignisphaera sp.]